MSAGSSKYNLADISTEQLFSDDYKYIPTITQQQPAAKPKFTKTNIFGQLKLFEERSAAVSKKLQRKPPILAIYCNDGFTVLSQSTLYKRLEAQKAKNLIEAIRMDFENLEDPLTAIENKEDTTSEKMDPPISPIVFRSKVVRTYSQRNSVSQKGPRPKKPKISENEDYEIPKRSLKCSTPLPESDSDSDSSKSDHGLDESFTVDGVTIINQSMEVEITNNSKISENLTQLSQFYVEQTQDDEIPEVPVIQKLHNEFEKRPGVGINVKLTVDSDYEEDDERCVDEDLEVSHNGWEDDIEEETLNSMLETLERNGSLQNSKDLDRSDKKIDSKLEVAEKSKSENQEVQKIAKIDDPNGAISSDANTAENSNFKVPDKPNSSLSNEHKSDWGESSSDETVMLFNSKSSNLAENLTLTEIMKMVEDAEVRNSNKKDDFGDVKSWESAKDLEAAGNLKRADDHGFGLVKDLEMDDDFEEAQNLEETKKADNFEEVQNMEETKKADNFEEAQNLEETKKADSFEIEEAQNLETTKTADDIEEVKDVDAVNFRQFKNFEEADEFQKSRKSEVIYDFKNPNNLEVVENLNQTHTSKYEESFSGAKNSSRAENMNIGESLVDSSLKKVTLFHQEEKRILIDPETSNVTVKFLKEAEILPEDSSFENKNNRAVNQTIEEELKGNEDLNFPKASDLVKPTAKDSIKTVSSKRSLNSVEDFKRDDIVDNSRNFKSADNVENSSRADDSGLEPTSKRLKNLNHPEPYSLTKEPQNAVRRDLNKAEETNSCKSSNRSGLLSLSKDLPSTIRNDSRKAEDSNLVESPDSSKTEEINSNNRSEPSRRLSLALSRTTNKVEDSKFGESSKQFSLSEELPRTHRRKSSKAEDADDKNSWKTPKPNDRSRRLRRDSNKAENSKLGESSKQFSLSEEIPRTLRIKSCKVEELKEAEDLNSLKTPKQTEILKEVGRNSRKAEELKKAEDLNSYKTPQPTERSKNSNSLNSAETTNYMEFMDSRESTPKTAPNSSRRVGLRPRNFKLSPIVATRSQTRNSQKKAGNSAQNKSTLDQKSIKRRSLGPLLTRKSTTSIKPQSSSSKTANSETEDIKKVTNYEDFTKSSEDCLGFPAFKKASGKDIEIESSHLKIGRKILREIDLEMETGGDNQQLETEKKTKIGLESEDKILEANNTVQSQMRTDSRLKSDENQQLETENKNQNQLEIEKTQGLEAQLQMETSPQFNNEEQSLKVDPKELQLLQSDHQQNFEDKEQLNITRQLNQSTPDSEKEAKVKVQYGLEFQTEGQQPQKIKNKELEQLDTDLVSKPEERQHTQSNLKFQEKKKEVYLSTQDMKAVMDICSNDFSPDSFLSKKLPTNQLSARKKIIERINFDDINVDHSAESFPTFQKASGKNIEFKESHLAAGKKMLQEVDRECQDQEKTNKFHLECLNGLTEAFDDDFHFLEAEDAPKFKTVSGKDQESISANYCQQSSSSSHNFPTFKKASVKDIAFKPDYLKTGEKLLREIDLEFNANETKSHEQTSFQPSTSKSIPDFPCFQKASGKAIAFNPDHIKTGQNFLMKVDLDLKNQESKTSEQPRFSRNSKFKPPSRIDQPSTSTDVNLNFPTFQKASGKNITVNPEGIKKGQKFLQQIDEELKIQEFSKSKFTSQQSSTNSSLNLPMFKKASGKDIVMNPEYIKKGENLLRQIDLELNNQEQANFGAQTSTSASNSNFPTFKKASGKDIAVNPDHYTKGQNLLLQVDLELKNQKPRNTKFKPPSRIDQPSTSTSIDVNLNFPTFQKASGKSIAINPEYLRTGQKFLQQIDEELKNKESSSSKFTPQSSLNSSLKKTSGPIIVNPYQMKTVQKPMDQKIQINQLTSVSKKPELKPENFVDLTGLTQDFAMDDLSSWNIKANPGSSLDPVPKVHIKIEKEESESAENPVTSVKSESFSSNSTISTNLIQTNNTVISKELETSKSTANLNDSISSISSPHAFSDSKKKAIELQQKYSKVGERFLKEIDVEMKHETILLANLNGSFGSRSLLSTRKLNNSLEKSKSHPPSATPRPRCNLFETSFKMEQENNPINRSVRAPQQEINTEFVSDLQNSFDEIC